MAVDTNGLLIQWDDLKIVSGEGTGEGHVENYTGPRTLRALKLRLKKEQAGGDRWALARCGDGTTYSVGAGAR